MHNVWALDVFPGKLTDGGEHEAALCRLFALIEPRYDAFIRLHQEMQGVEITISGGLYVARNSQCGIWLEPEQMDLLARCGIGWGLNLFVDEDERY